MSSVFTYTPKDPELVYNIKWTVLQHVMYIVNHRGVFKDLYPGGLENDHFYDSLSADYNNLPAFGIDYMGRRIVGAESEDIFSIRYVGKNININPLNRYGVQSENRRLLRVHDILIHNLEWLSKNGNLVMYKFTDENLDPVISQLYFTMDLIDSIPSRDEASHARVNALEMTFGITINL